VLRRELSAFLKGGSRMATATAEPRSVPTTEGDGHKHKKNALSDGQGRLAWILLAPTLLVIIVVAGIPVALSIREAFFQTNTGVDPNTGMIAGGEIFVGLQNFTDIFTGQNPVVGNFGTMDRFWNAFLNTTFITIVCVLIETVLGVAMALIMAKAFRGRGIVRAGILVPWAIPTIVSALMWKLIFDSSGVMNRILGREILWLADTGASFWAIIIADTWKTAPFIALLTLAGLQTIPAEVYEAAKVDGATTWQQFIRITLPMVKPTLVVAVLFRTLDTLRMFDLPYGMIGAGKYRVETLSIFAYQEATQERYGPSAAYAIVLFIYVLLVAFLFVRILGADVIGDADVPKKKKKKKGDGGADQNRQSTAALEQMGGAH
jgi:ABC-type sugar transport system permease subunit